MIFDLNRQNETPLYLQIKDRISRLIDDGTLAASDRLPPSRELARSLAVNRNTVVKAYEELEVEGKVRSGVGRGTFVTEFARTAQAPQPQEPMAQAEFDGLWSRVGREHDETEWGELFFHLPHSPDVTALSSCLPDKKTFPMREFRNCAYYALQNYGADLLDIGPTQGFVPFLEYLPKYLLRHGMHVQPNHIIITSGIQQGIDLVARTFVNPGDTVITEEFTYPRAISVFRSLGADLVGIPVDRDGMKVETLEQVLSWRKPKLIYTIPTFHNPTGTTMTLERRRRLLELSALYKIPILEDHYANHLRLDGPALLPLAAMDRQGWVVAVGSISKILFHGLRVGWVISPLDSLRRRIVSLKQSADLQTNYLVQGIILEFMLRGYLEKYLKRRLAQLRARRDNLRHALKEYLAEPAWWYDVDGGVCYWLNLPPPLRADQVLLEARKRSVVFAPKHMFSVNPAPNDAMRLGFTDLDEERARHGVRVIGQVVRKMLAGGRKTPLPEEREYARVHV